MRPLAAITRLAGRAVRGLARASASASDWLKGNQWISLAGAEDADVRRPMSESEAVFAGFRALCETTAGFPLQLFRGKATEPLTGGPAYDLLEEPTPGQGLKDWIKQWVGHYISFGEAHIVMVQETGKRITSLPIWGKRQVGTRLDADGKLLFWMVGPRGTPVLPEEDAYARIFDFDEPIRGTGALQAASLALKQDRNAGIFNLAVLRNGVHPKGFLVFPEGISEEQIKEHVSGVEARHQGAERAGRLLALGGGPTYQSTLMNAGDADLYPGRKFSAGQIFSVLGVPPVVVGIYEGATYDVMSHSFRFFVLLTIRPLGDVLLEVLNKRILPLIEPGVVARFDWTQHDVLQELLLGRLDYHVKAFAQGGVPYNRSIKLCGLALPPEPWGDVSLVPSGLAPATEVIAGLNAPPEVLPAEETPTPPETRNPEPGTRITGGTPMLPGRPMLPVAAALAAEARSEERQIRALIPGIRQRFRSFFLRQEREILARLRKELNATAKTPRPPENTEGFDSLGALGALAVMSPGALAVRPWERAADDEAERIAKRVLLRITDEQGRLRKLARDYFPKAVEQTLRSELKRLGFADERIEAAVKKWTTGRWVQAIVRTKETKITDIEVTSRKRLVATLSNGVRAGEPVTKLADRVHAVLGANRARCLTIARNEAGQAVSVARFAAATASGANGKYWITGANPRATHIVAGQVYNRGGAIPMAEAFEVGGEQLMYPRDPTGSAGEIINCNCVLVSVRLNATAKAPSAPRNSENFSALGGLGALAVRSLEIVNAIGAARPEGRGSGSAERNAA